MSKVHRERKSQFLKVAERHFQESEGPDGTFYLYKGQGSVRDFLMQVVDDQLSFKTRLLNCTAMTYAVKRNRLVTEVTTQGGFLMSASMFYQLADLIAKSDFPLRKR